jgi:hypothetical protein
MLLLIAGAFFLAAQLVPNFGVWVNQYMAWPWFIIGAGIVFFLFGLFFRQEGLIVAACVVGGIGGILYYQNMTGNWASWAYAWALIPGFSGIGVVLGGLISGSPSRDIWRGVDAIVTSAVLFIIFASFMGGFNLLGKYWPLLLVGAGVLLLARAIFRRQA